MTGLYYSLAHNLDNIMEEVIKEVRQNDGKKLLRGIHTGSIREVVEVVNRLGLQKDDILQVVHTDDGFFLLYFS